MQTKSYDEFNPLDDVWHGVVGEPGGILIMRMSFVGGESSFSIVIGHDFHSRVPLL